MTDSSTGPAAAPAAYLRQPAVQGDTLVFVTDDDLWRVSASGGEAVRLTAGLGEAATPALSPCGRWVAYAGRDQQHSEVWVLPTAGGPARRLTYLGADLAVRGFTPEGRIVFTCNHGQPFFRHWFAWTIAVEGGVPERLALGPADHLAFGAAGQRAIGRNTGDPARWKRYRGGRAGHLWVSATPEAPFQRLEALQGNVSCPMWLGDRLYFIGDHEGVGNLYSSAPDGSGVTRHTEHSDYYARHAATDGQRIVYQQGAQLWLFDPAAGAGGSKGATRALDIHVPSARTQAARRFVPVAEHLQGLSVHPQGHSLAAEVRGQVLTMPLWEGAPRRHGDLQGRQRHAHWLADGSTLVAVSDASGEERLITQATGAAQGQARTWPWDIGRVTALAAAPSGQRVALANHRNELWLADFEAQSFTRLSHSAHGRIEHPAWSPCGGYVACTYPTSGRHTAIQLVELASGATHLATTPEFHDYAPAFDPEGRYLYFLSLRTYDPVYDSVQFELSFPRGGRPYLIALQSGGRPPFDPEPRGMGQEPGGGDAKKGSAGSADKAAADAKERSYPLIETTGLVRRIAPFPVAEGLFGQIAGVARGKVVWTQLPVLGAHGRGGHKEPAGRLEVFDFATGRAATLLPEAESFSLAADHRTLLVKAGKTVRAIDATREADERGRDGGGGGAGGEGSGASRRSGVVDLTRLRVAVDPPAEWAQMLREVWRLQRDQFWVAGMSGVDWSAMYERYAALLPRVATRGELSDLIWELQAELGTSHAYEMGGDYRRPPAVALGQLAAELRPAPAGQDGWTLVRTVQGDAWDAGADSPLNAVGVEARAGERLVAVAGQPVQAGTHPGALLVNLAGQRVSLTLAGTDGTSREVLVTLLADEAPARYREWVERNRAHVHAASGGRVGYLHVPDMQSAGFAEFHRYFGTECDHEALIVDVRFNRGGHVSQLLLEKVARRRTGWDVSRWCSPQPYPYESPAGAVVALTNEHAGSDGDIFSHNFKLMGIGPLVGKRTWGGVIGIWPRHKLADGTETTQPEFSFWFKDVGFGVENYGTDPTVEIDNTPEDDVFNAPERDRQLARALEVAMQAQVVRLQPPHSRATAAGTDSAS